MDAVFDNPDVLSAFKAYNSIDHCSGSPYWKMQTPWNPADYQISGIPIVYVHGDQDAQVSVDWAHQHFDGQRTPKKVFISAKWGGHSVIHDGGVLSSCAGFFFESLLSPGGFHQIAARADAISQSGCAAVSALSE